MKKSKVTDYAALSKVLYAQSLFISYTQLPVSLLEVADVWLNILHAEYPCEKQWVGCLIE